MESARLGKSSWRQRVRPFGTGAAFEQRPSPVRREFKALAASHCPGEIGYGRRNVEFDRVPVSRWENAPTDRAREDLRVGFPRREQGLLGGRRCEGESWFTRCVRFLCRRRGDPGDTGLGIRPYERVRKSVLDAGSQRRG